MAQLLNRVQPGDVITAEMWNLLVDAVNELLQAGQTTGIQIAAMLPAGTQSEPIRISTLKEMYEYLELPTDNAENVTDVLQSVAVKNS